jgi:RNA recognition motif-containing protein
MMHYQGPPDTNPTKRGSEQIDSNTSELWGSQHDTRSSNAKKPKINDQSPKKVLHVRNLPFDCTDDELISLSSGFGPVKHVLILTQKNQRGQAFVEMEELENAIALVQYYSNAPPMLRYKHAYIPLIPSRGRSIYFQYSSREALTFSNDQPKQSQSYSNQSSQSYGNQHSQSYSNQPSQPYNNQPSQSPVLLVTVQNLLYPVTIESLYQIFSPYGAVTKIIISQLNSPSKLAYFVLTHLHSKHAVLRTIFSQPRCKGSKQNFKWKKRIYQLLHTIDQSSFDARLVCAV